MMQSARGRLNKSQNVPHTRETSGRYLGPCGAIWGNDAMHRGGRRGRLDTFCRYMVVEEKSMQNKRVNKVQCQIHLMDSKPSK